MKTLFKIDDIDFNKILVSKKEPYAKKKHCVKSVQMRSFF